VEEVEQEDSAFLEPEYSNPSSFDSFQGRHHARPYVIDNEDEEDEEEEDDGNYSSPCPDYEEVDPLQIARLRRCLQNTSLDLMATADNMTNMTATLPASSLNTGLHDHQLRLRNVTRTSLQGNGAPLTNGLVYNLASEAVTTRPTSMGIQGHNQGSRIKIGLNSPALVRNVRNRWSANLEAIMGGPTINGAGQSDLRTSEEAQKQETIMKSVINCIHKEEGCKWFGHLNKLKAHLNVCQKDAVECLNQCGAKIARMMMEDHMLYTCVKRLVDCSYCKKDFTGATIEEHTAKCGFEPIHCENKCGQRIQRNRIRAHVANTCSKRLIDCAYCAKSFTADTLQAHHGQCRRFPVVCPNRCTTTGKPTEPNRSNATTGQPTSGSTEAATFPREELERHMAECNQSVEQTEYCCTFKSAGCKFVAVDPHQVDLHLKANLQLHLDLMCSLVHKQEAHIKRLTGQLDRAQTSYNGILVWKIRGIREKMAEAKKTGAALELVSVPFYTSQCGYKLQASLFVNGNGAGEDTHMSIYIKILPGEYDGILRWPFKHTVSFTLLDQSVERKNAINIVESFLPDPSWPNFQRPSHQPDQLGFGFPKFVSHEMLGTRSYVKEDCLFIKIRVDPSRNVAV